jgi:hypothetical protein
VHRRKLATWLLLFGGCLIGCAKRCSEAPAPLHSAASRPSSPARSAQQATIDEPVAAPGLPPPAVRAALLKWGESRKQKSENAGREIVHRVEFVDSEGGRGHDVVVREELGSGQECSASLWLIIVPWESPVPSVDVLPDKRLGADCCAQARCLQRPAAGWMVRLLASVRQRDLPGARELVDPQGGLDIESVCSGDGCPVGGEGEQTTHLRREDVDLRLLSEAIGLSLESDELSCEESVADRFSCWAHGGGYEGTFDWKRKADRAYLVRARAHGH